MIYIILGKLAQSESNVLRLYLGIYPIEESETETRLHSHHTVSSSCRHRKTFTRSSCFLHLPAVRMGCYWLSFGQQFMGRGDVSHLQFLFFLFLINLFIDFWLRWVFVAAHGLSLVAESGGYSSLWCMGFSLWWLLLLRSTGSRHMGFSSCGTWAQQLWCMGLAARGMWDLRTPGLKPVSPALAGRFLTTAPPGKSHQFLVLKITLQCPPGSSFPYAVTLKASSSRWRSYKTEEAWAPVAYKCAVFH